MKYRRAADFETFFFLFCIIFLTHLSPFYPLLFFFFHQLFLIRAWFAPCRSWLCLWPQGCIIPRQPVFLGNSTRLNSSSRDPGAGTWSDARERLFDGCSTSPTAQFTARRCFFCLSRAAFARSFNLASFPPSGWAVAIHADLSCAEMRKKLGWKSSA